MASSTRPPRLAPDTVERSGAIVIADQAGFTHSVLTRGPAAALEDIWTTRRLLIPVFTGAGGEVFKVDADNLYIYFRAADDALRGALTAHVTLAAENRRGRRRPPLGVGIGIGFGDLLYLPSEEDYYGAEVNLASKLGEDVAPGGMTLLTRGAVAALSGSAPGRSGRRRRARIGGLTIWFQEWLQD